MSTRQRQPERIVARPLSIPDWTGHLSRTDGISGRLICSSTGWRLDLTATPDGPAVLMVTARFGSPTLADDAMPWTTEHELAKPHERGQAVTGNPVTEQDQQLAGPATQQPYDCMWTGYLKRQGDAWAGQLGDRYGGRLTITGKPQGNGVIALRAVASVSNLREAENGSACDHWSSK